MRARLKGTAAMQTHTDHSQADLYGASLERSERLGDRRQSVTTMNHWYAARAPQWPSTAP